jgi:uncharacterized membrane protein
MKLKCLIAVTVVKARSSNARNASSNWSTLVVAALLLVAFMGGMGVLDLIVFTEVLSSPSFAAIGGILVNIWL